MIENKAFFGAYKKGRKARAEGRPITTCPYGDLRTDRGGVTFSRAFIRAWKNGWNGKIAGWLGELKEEETADERLSMSE